jgi:hypothetical protein
MMKTNTIFAILSIILLTATATVALYTVNAAHTQAQSNMTSTGGTAKNMTGETVNKTGEALTHKTNLGGIVCTMNQPNEPRIC